MLFSVLGIAFALGLSVTLVYAFIFMAKAKTPVFKPLFAGGLCMFLGTVLASVLLLLLHAALEAGGKGFLEADVAGFYLTLITGALVTAGMFFALKRPLAARRSAYESLAFGLGVALPLFVYRAAGAVVMSGAYLVAGAGAADSLLLLLENVADLLLALGEAACAVFLAHLLNQKKPASGFFAALLFELVLRAALSLEAAFGIPGWYGRAFGFVLLALACWYDLRVWKRFPPRQEPPRKRGVNQNIPWPEPGDDGK